MLSHIKQQLAEGWRAEDESGRNHGNDNTLNPLDKQLNYQTEYNNTLLAQLGELETECSYLNTRLIALDQENSDAKQEARLAEQRVADLHRKLSMSSQLCDRLSEQCSELREQNKELQLSLHQQTGQLDGLQFSSNNVLEKSHALSERIADLEARLAESELVRARERNEERARCDALTKALETSSEDFVHGRSVIRRLEGELLELKEENLVYRTRCDKFHLMLESQQSEKASLESQLSRATSQLHNLQHRARQLELERNESIEKNEITQLEMTFAERSQHIAADLSHRADEKWRTLEGLLADRERELAMAQENNDRLERLAKSLQQKSKSEEERWNEREKMILADSEFQLQQASEKLEATKAELADSRREVLSEQRRCGVLAENSAKQLDELRAQMHIMKSEFDEKIDEAVRSRDEAFNINRDLRCSLDDAISERKAAMSSMKRNVEDHQQTTKKLQGLMTARGLKFVSTLELLQSAVRQCLEESVEVKLKNAYLSSQLSKLLDILKNLSSSPVGPAGTPQRFNATSSLSGETSIETVPIALRPIRIYGDEIKRSFMRFSKRVADSARAIEDLQSDLKQTKRSLEETIFALDEERSESFTVKKALATSKTQLQQLERELDNRNRTIADRLNALEISRNSAVARAEKAEERGVELTGQLTLLQAQLSKTDAEIKAVRTSYGIETHKLEDRLTQKDTMAETIKQQFQDLCQKYEKVVGENRKESEQRIRIRDELKKCREIAEDTASSFVAEKEKLHEQLKSMHNVLSNYEIQLKQKESLLDVVKSQRTELAAELKVLKSNDPTRNFDENSYQSDAGANYSADSSGYLNSRFPTTSLAYVYHASEAGLSSEHLLGFSSKLKTLTQSISQMERDGPHSTQSRSFLDTSILRRDVGNRYFRTPALDPDNPSGRDLLSISAIDAQDVHRNDSEQESSLMGIDDLTSRVVDYRVSPYRSPVV